MDSEGSSAVPGACNCHVPRQINDAAAGGADTPGAMMIGVQKEASQAAGPDAPGRRTAASTGIHSLLSVFLASIGGQWLLSLGHEAAAPAVQRLSANHSNI